MFGYVNINPKELKGKEVDRYQAFYCGFCRKLKSHYGVLGQMTLSYDMTFLILLLTALYEPDTKCVKSRCVLHPFKARETFDNEYVSYACDMNIMLSYYKCLDDWEDEKKVTRYLLSVLLKGKNEKVSRQYEQKAKIIYDNLKAIQECEKEQKKEGSKELSEEYLLDTAAGYFGNIMEELFLYRKDEWEVELRQMGFYLGKFLYLMDAYEDMEKDLKTGNYNPVLTLYQKAYPCYNKINYVPEFEERMKAILSMMMAECAKAFERLPILEDVQILRNIIYSGVWSRYEGILEKRKKNSGANSEQ